MKVIMSDEGQGETERAEVAARAFKRLAGLPTGQLRAGLAEVVSERKRRQAIADSSRYKRLTEAALSANATSWANYCSAVIDGTVKLPRLPDGYKPRRKR